MKTKVGVVLAAMLAGCGGEDGNVAVQDGGVADGGAGCLPPEVARVLEAQCQSCHSASPQYGAPMALTSYAHTQAPTPTAPGTAVWRTIGQRIHDMARPMPPTRLNAADMAVLDGWIAANAPPSTAASCAPTTMPPPVMPSPDTQLPCTPSQRFVAHANGNTAAYRVPGASGNTEVCYAFRSPFAAGTLATAFAARVDNSRVLHHAIIFATETAQTDGAVFPCNGNMPRDATFLAGWAPGNQGTVLPNDVGVELPATDGYFILQVHYWNTTADDALDTSGIALCTTTTPRAHIAAVHTLGSADIRIPARATDHAVVGNCTPTATEPVHIIGWGPHMHRNGFAMTTEILRDGASTMAMNVPDYSFDAQVSRPADLVLQPGATLRTTCRYRNPTSSPVYFGEETEDEMCFNFVLAWPAGALSNRAGRGGRRCIDVR